MTNKTIMIGLVAIAFVAGSIMTSTVAYASEHQNGTPFLQEELDVINAIVEDILLDITELQNLQVSWVDLIDIPADFADDIDNDLLAGLSCSTDQIIKWDGTQWNCTDSASDSLAGDFALRKVDCNIVGLLLDLDFQFDTTNGCDLVGVDLDAIEIPSANLSLADLTGAEFDEADLSNVDFSGANLSGVDFSGTNLSGAIFTGAFADPPCFEHPICDTLPTS